MGRYRLPVGGDIIVAVNSQAVHELQDLTVYLEAQTTVGDTVQVTILRDGREITLPVKLAEQPQA
jgi:S1-C subfamily serine protease